MGHALNGSIQDALIRMQRMRGPQHALDPRHRPRRDRHPGGGREGARQGGDVSRHELGREKFVERVWEWKEQYGSQIVEQYKRLGASCDYERERFTLDEGYVTRGLPRLHGPLREGPDLPRQLHGQLGPGAAIGDLRPRGREPRGRRHDLRDRLPARGRRRAGRGDGAAGDDARRHGGGREPRRRALQGRGRQERDPAAGRPQAAGDRRRARRARVRDRGAEDHPGPRPERLRDRPRPRPRGDRGDRRGRPHDRGRRRALRRDDRRRGAEGGGRGAARARAACAARSPTGTRCRSRTAPASGSSR